MNIGNLVTVLFVTILLILFIKFIIDSSFGNDNSDSNDGYFNEERRFNNGDSYSNWNNTGKTYEEILQDSRWREKRLRILKRDNNKCIWCNRTYGLQVHHKYYLIHPDGKFYNPWEYPDDALITLCDYHHKWIHSRKKIKTYYK